MFREKDFIDDLAGRQNYKLLRIGPHRGNCRQNSTSREKKTDPTKI